MSSTEEKSQDVPRENTPKVSEELVKSLVEMGFSEEKAKLALSKVNPPTTDGALNWLVENGDKSEQGSEDGGDTPKVCRSYKCVETGKLFRSMQDAQLYAERTGKSNFEESEEEVPPLSEEEKKQKLEQLREKIKKKREEREENEKKEALQREIQRRKDGQNMASIREEHERLQRKRDIEKIQREKEIFKQEKERLRKEVARDKAERASEAARRRGEDPQACKKAYDIAYAKALGKALPDGTKPPAVEKKFEDQLKDAITDLLSYRAGGDGIKALTTIKKMFSNIVKSPEEEKFRQVNLQNEAFKKRVAVFRGGVALFKAVGFEKIAGQEKLKLEQMDMDRLKKGLEEIIKAIEAN